MHPSNVTVRLVLVPHVIKGQRDGSWLMGFFRSDGSLERFFFPKEKVFGWFGDIYPWFRPFRVGEIFSLPSAVTAIPNAAALGFALGNMKNRKPAEIEQHITHEKMYIGLPKRKLKPVSSPILPDFYMIFLNMYRLLVNILGPFHSFPPKKATWF